LGTIRSSTETTSTTGGRPAVAKPSGTEIPPLPAVRTTGRTGCSPTLADQRTAPAGRVRSSAAPAWSRVKRSRWTTVPSTVTRVVVSRSRTRVGRRGEGGRRVTARETAGAEGELVARRQAAVRSRVWSASPRAGGRSERSTRDQLVAGAGWTSAATEEATTR
jgi:hypothetical protein